MPFAWVTADEAYGQVKYLRVWLEQRGAAYVLATKRNDTVITESGERRVDELVIGLPARAWRRLSVGADAHGPRDYGWARVPIRIGWRPGRGHWLLARRKISNPDEVAYYLLRYGPRRATLADLAWTAGSRWRIEECFAQAKNEAGLDHYQVRTFPAWYAHITLSMLALAWLAAAREQATKGDPVPRRGHDRLDGTGDPPAARAPAPATHPPARARLELVSLAPTTPIPSPPLSLPTTKTSTHVSAVAVLERVSDLEGYSELHRQDR